MPEQIITFALQVKYCVLLCGDDIDPHVRHIHLFDDRKFLLNIRSKVVKAASGALAMLTSASNKICNKVFSSYLLSLTLSHLFGMYCTFIFSCMLLLYRRCLSPSSGTTACSTCSPTPTTRSCCAARSSSSIWSPSAKMLPRRSLRLR